jgi:primosomal protein N' (replication factor Y)
MISYERFLEISIHMDRKKHVLDEQALAQINAIKKTLNIPIKENLKKTVVNKKEDISQIFKLLNKITDKNYDKLKEGSMWLYQVMQQSLPMPVLGPEEPAISRIRNEYIRTIMVKIPSTTSIVTTKNTLQKILNS